MEPSRYPARPTSSELFLIALLPIVALLSGSPAVAAPTGPFLDQEGPFVLETDDHETEVDDAVDTGLPGAATCEFRRLADGVPLPENPALYTIWNRRKAWGTQRLVDTLVFAAEEMAWRFPNAQPLMIGDLSYSRGGWMSGHRSHRGGLDADVGIYFGNAQQHQVGLRTVPVSQLDLDANLAFVQTLLATGDVERILLDRRLIRALRDHAIESGAMTEDVARATFLLPGDALETSPWNLYGVVHHVPGHHHHFHVRVRCGE